MTLIVIGTACLGITSAEIVYRASNDKRQPTGSGLALGLLRVAAFNPSTTTMFKSAATGLAHRPTVRAVAPENPDLKPIKDVIATLNDVLQSYAHTAAPTIQILISRFQDTET